MKNISIAALILLTSCEAINKNESSIKKIAHDAVDEAIENFDKKKDKEAKHENGMVIFDPYVNELHLLYNYGSYSRGSK